MEIKAKYTEVAKLTSHVADMIKNNDTSSEEFELLTKQLVTLSNNVSNNDISENFYFSPIHSAAQNGNIALLDILIKNGANINAYNNHAITENGKGTPVMVALRNGQLEAYKFLAENGAALNMKGEVLISALQGYNVMLLETIDLESDGDIFEASSMKEFLYNEFRPIINSLYEKCNMLKDKDYFKTLKELAEICEIKFPHKQEEMEI